jgi:hypothetical protein
MPSSEPPVGEAARRECSGEATPQNGTHDAAIARILGLFLAALAVAVLAGTAFATLAIDRILNVAAALVLAATGAGFLLSSRRHARRAKPCR